MTSRSQEHPTLFLVVPMFNEAPNIDRLMRSLAELSAGIGDRVAMRVLLVDDGSRDDTVSRVRAHLEGGPRCEILELGVNRGPGAAFAAAFERLGPMLQSSDWVLTMEGDNTSRIELVGRMLTRAAEGFDVVLASPYLYGGGLTSTSIDRSFLSAMANLFLKEVLGLRGIATMSSFFRLHSGALMLRLQQIYGPRIVERDGFESMVEMLIKIVLLSASVSEIAMVLDDSQSARPTTMKTGRTIVGYLTLRRDIQRWRAMGQSGGA